MRFENSALERGRIDSPNLDNLRRARETAHDLNRGNRNVSQFRQKSYDRFVRFAIHGRRGDVKFPGVTEPSREFSFPSPGPDLKRESCFHLPPFSAIRYVPADR